MCVFERERKRERESSVNAKNLVEKRVQLAIGGFFQPIKMPNGAPWTLNSIDWDSVNDSGGF